MMILWRISFGLNGIFKKSTVTRFRRTKWNSLGTIEKTSGKAITRTRIIMVSRGACPSGRKITLVWRYNESEVTDLKVVFVITAY